ncbi:acyltransferase family protein [Candidatus Enterococcus ikei]|uniref:Acyltransferase n=1 Tax=Candidatus Enterococcus ikei TaxID=2815326 RepID=A0ABS3GZU4_9ENTE|nr:acyltransferase [Enterococcus sp. DIV0869a]
MNGINKQVSKQTIGNNGIDVIKYAAAVLIICFHCERVIQDPVVHHLFKNVLCRIAVPYFLISTSYFVRRGQNSSPGYLKRYLKSMINSYLFWSLIYLPIGFMWIQENYTLGPQLYPVALFAGLVYTGTYYHLWYIPAMIFGIIFAHWLIKKKGYIPLFCLTFVLCLFGSLETYYGYIENEQLKSFFDQYLNVFVTTRNGLFFALVFVAVGYFLWDYREKIAGYQKYFGLMVVVFGGLLVSEGLMIYAKTGIDKNFMWSLIPFTAVFFCWSLTWNLKIAIDYKHLRNLGKYYFFIHPLCILWAASLVNSYDFFANSWLQLVVTLIATHLLSSLVIVINNQLPYYYFDLQLMLRVNKGYRI